MTEGTSIINLSKHLWGKCRYVLGAEVNIPRPIVDFAWYDRITRLDCSEDTQATFGAFGIYLPDGSGAQGDYLKPYRITIEEALHTPAAILGHYPGYKGQTYGHVIMSRGDGSKMSSEARGKAYGVGTWGILGRPFQWASKVPGVTNHGIPDAPPPSGSLAELMRALFFAKLFRFGVPDGPGVLNEHSPGAADACKFLQVGLNRFFRDFAILTHQPDPPDIPVNGSWDDLTHNHVIFLQGLINHNELGTTGPETWKALYP